MRVSGASDYIHFVLGQSVRERERERERAAFAVAKCTRYISPTPASTPTTLSAPGAMQCPYRTGLVCASF